MWCRNCNIQTNAATCPVCLSKTEDVVETDTFWCDNCNIPVIRYRNDHDKATCPICSGKIHYLAVDIRPVFPEERLLLAILLDKEPDKYMSDSVWAANSRYYINGQPIALPSSLFQNADTDTISKSIAESQSIISYHSFNEMVERFISANKWRLDFIKDEARSFIKSAAVDISLNKDPSSLIVF